MINNKLAVEEKFHDQWAIQANIESIDVITMNEAATAPEMRYIIKALGDIREKKILDVGCGLGEASVYFALKGAQVIATDLSQQMLEATKRLAEKYKVSLLTIKADSQNFLAADYYKQFDIIYVGNLLHHVDINETLQTLKNYLKPEGTFISWDPVAYNPLINIYRIMAQGVRTPDEHPLKLADIKTFKKHFSYVEKKPFWFFTLVVFVLMFIFGSIPGKERFWKKIITDHKKWAWLYKPLKWGDDFVLGICSWLWPLCWNIVIIAKKPIIS